MSKARPSQRIAVRTLSGRLTQRAHARVACVGVTMLLPRQSIARAAKLSYLRAAAPASMAAASPRAGRPSPHLLTLPQAGSAQCRVIPALSSSPLPPLPLPSAAACLPRVRLKSSLAAGCAEAAL